MDWSKVDEYFSPEPSDEEQYEMMEKESEEEKKELFQFLNENSYEGLDKHLDKVKVLLESFNAYFTEDAKSIFFKNFIFHRDLIKQVVFQSSNRVENVIDFVTAKQSVDTENKEKYETIQHELTEAKANLEFMGKRIQHFIDQVVDAGDDERLLINAYNELRSQAKAKPFLVQVDNAITINQRIKLESDFRLSLN